MITMDGNGNAINMNEDDDDNDEFNNGDWDGGEDGDGDGDGNEERNHDPNAMDWSPIAPTNNRRSVVKMTNGQVQQYHYPGRQQRHQHQQLKTNGNRRWDDGNWLRPQRFFVPEEPTGLEGLFEQTISLSDDDRLRVGGGGSGGKGVQEGKGEWLGWAKRRWRSEQ